MQTNITEFAHDLYRHTFALRVQEIMLKNSKKNVTDNEISCTEFAPSEQNRNENNFCQYES